MKTLTLDASNLLIDSNLFLFVLNTFYFSIFVWCVFISFEWYTKHTYSIRWTLQLRWNFSVFQRINRLNDKMKKFITNFTFFFCCELLYIDNGSTQKLTVDFFFFLKCSKLSKSDKEQQTVEKKNETRIGHIWLCLFSLLWIFVLLSNVYAWERY